MSTWVTITSEGRKISLSIDEEKLKEASLLDGCYVLKSNVSPEKLNTSEVHEKYKDLALVETAFRTIKTGCLEVRPVYVRKEKRTREHLFVTMLAYMLIHEFRRRTVGIERTLEDMMDSLEQIQTVILSLSDNIKAKRIPE